MRTNTHNIKDTVAMVLGTAILLAGAVGISTAPDTDSFLRLTGFVMVVWGSI